MSKQRNWFVPVTLTRTSHAVVKAASAEEAAAKVDEGSWDELFDGELLAVDVAGEPEEE